MFENSSSCVWIDSSWEIQQDRTVWKLGCLWRNHTTTNDGHGGLYVQSDALQESDFRHLFRHDLGLDIDVSSTTGLAKTFATALLQFRSSTEPHLNTNSIPLSFSGLEMTAAFPLATDTTGTRTEVAPVLLSRLQYTTPSATDANSSLTLVEESIAMFQAWKARLASLKMIDKELLLPVADNKALEPPPSNPKKSNVVKRSSVQGCYKIQQRSKRKPGLKFMGQG